MRPTTNPKRTTIQRPDWLPESAWPYQIKTAYLNEIPIAFTDEGVGPTLLLVHDGMWSYIWGQIIEPLREKFRVITLDFPGAGLSPEADRPVGLEADSYLLESFVDHLGLDRLTLVLHDLGGPVGIGLAARRPELIQGMVLTQTFTWPPHVWSLRAMLRMVSSRPITALDVSTNLVPKLTTTRAGIGRHLGEDARAAFLGPYHHKGPRRRFHKMMGSGLAELGYLASLEEALRTTLSNQPVLTIYGENNDPFGFQARYKEFFPDAEEIVVPGGNHFPMADDPGGFVDRLEAWHRRKIQEREGGRLEDAVDV
jgi:haloalkane dehalogenase